MYICIHIIYVYIYIYIHVYIYIYIYTGPRTPNEVLRTFAPPIQYSDLSDLSPSGLHHVNYKETTNS